MSDCPRCNPPKEGEKRCFQCRKNKPLEAFDINPSNYQRPANKGRAYCCKQCVEERDNGETT